MFSPAMISAKRSLTENEMVRYCSSTSPSRSSKSALKGK
ncbi:Uncharacterised protein [Vibrio cholerae]|nr:Uncharacterised protein [Vibrio cholerae]